MANSCLNGILGNLKTTYLGVLSHNAVPCHNLTHSDDIIFPDSDVIQNIQRKFVTVPCEKSLPLPMFPPTKIRVHEINGIDPCLELVNEKKKWIQQKNLILGSCKSIPKNVRNKLNQNLFTNDSITLPENLADLSEHVSVDPDKMFSGFYDWYFTGGNLSTVSIGGCVYLVSVGSDLDDCFYLSKLKNKKKSGWCPDLYERFAVPIPCREPVYQIESFDNGYFARQKNTVSLMKCKIKDGVVLVNCPYILKSVKSLTSLAAARGEQTNYCTLSIDGAIEVHDIQKESILNKGLIEYERIDNWGAVKYFNDNSSMILHCDRRRVGILDLRVTLNEYACEWEQPDESCNNFSCLFAADYSEYSYVGSRHYLYALDPRRGFTKRWAHNMTHYPTTIKSSSFLSNKCIILGSQRSDRIVLLVNSMITEYRPESLPSPLETLHVARIDEALLSPVVRSRFTACLTGLVSLPPGHNQQLSVISSSSYGDIFLQKVIPLKGGSYVQKSYNPVHHPYVPLAEEDLTCLNNWQSQCELLLELSKFESHASNVINVNDLVEKILCTMNKQVGLEEVNTKMNDTKAGWCISKQNLLKYNDLLAQKLLIPWNIEEQDEWDDVKEVEDDSESDEEENHFNKKVKEWIEKCSDNRIIGQDLEESVSVSDDVESDFSENKLLPMKTVEEQTQKPVVFEESLEEMFTTKESDDVKESFNEESHTVALFLKSDPPATVSGPSRRRSFVSGF